MKLGINVMKTTLVVLFFLCATTAFGQNVNGSTALSAQPIITEFPSHPEHAAPHPMGEEHNLREASGYVYAQGERPLWDVVHTSRTIPLGDVARLLRKQNAKTRKAEIIWEN